MDFYYNGAPDGSVAYTEPSVVAGADQTIGAGDIPTFAELDGFIDELRLSTTDRSVEWIETSYNNQDNRKFDCGLPPKHPLFHSFFTF